MWILKIFIIINLILGAIHALPVSRVVGGKDAPEGKYPHQVSINILGQHACGGSILNDRFIITAAHCVTGTREIFTKIRVGTNKLNSGGIEYSVDKFFIHNFDPVNVLHDLALIRTSKRIIFNKNTQPIKLPYKDFQNHGYPVVATGWGRTSKTGNIPNKLQEIQLLIYDQSKCLDLWSIIKTSHICTLTVHGEGVCMGDSGGPLVADGYLIGIVSFGEPCAVGQPDVYTRVYYYLDWIKKIIKNV